MNDQDIQKLDELLQKRLKESLQNVATKEDIKTSATKITKDLTQVITDFAETLDNKKADKTQTLSLEVRLNKLERKVFPQ